MSPICPLIKEPCIRENCEMWLSTDIGLEKYGRIIDKNFHFEDCAFRVIAGRPKLDQLSGDHIDEENDESMTGN